MESQFGLSPIIDELRQTDSVDVAISGLKLLIKIFKFAPNPVSQIRIRHELNGNFEIKKKYVILELNIANLIERTLK